MKRMTTSMLMAWLVASAAAPLSRAHQVPPSPTDRAGIAFFEEHIRPLLVEQCYKCHSSQAKAPRGGLLLDSKAGWAKGGDNGPAVLPGDADRSLLIRAVRHLDDLKMPPKSKLSEKQIDLLVRWVKMGRAGPARRGSRPEDHRHRTGPQTLGVSAPAKCRASRREGSRGLVPHDDRSLHPRQARGEGAAPNAAAERRTLIRRATFDLLGLPPTPEEIEAFAHDPDPDAYGKLIDRLLDSPHYGERWARHWMDVARFAESHGYEQDYDRPFAYPYRDFLIRR